MGTIVHGRHVHAPVVGVALGNLFPDGLAVVEVLAFAILKLAQLALPVQLAHLTGCTHEAVILGVGIDLAGALHSLYQFHGFLHGLAGQNLTHDMLTRLHAADGKGNMLRGVVGQNHRIHIMLQKFLEVGIIGNSIRAQLGLHALEKIRGLVAHSNQFRIGCLGTVFNHGFAASCAQNANSYLFHNSSSYVCVSSDFHTDMSWRNL